MSDDAPVRRPADAPDVRIRVDPYDGDGRIMVIDGVDSSYVALSDPTRLEFEYTRWIAHLLEVSAPPGPLTVVHVGGGGATLPRYVAATRPGSRQLVLESSAEVLELARTELKLDDVAGLRLTHGDGLAGLLTQPAASTDVVVRDAFTGEQVPEHLRTPFFCAQVRRVLRPGGLYLANIACDVDLAAALAEAQVTLETFAELALVAEPGLLRGRRYGNVVLAAAARPLPVPELARRLGTEPVPGRVLTTEQVRRLMVTGTNRRSPADRLRW